MLKRQRIKIGKKYYYAERNNNGQFTDITAINKSIKKDSQKKAKIVKPGFGHIGDLKRRRFK